MKISRDKAININELKLNGYYYFTYKSGHNNGLTNVYFLYENGVLLDAMGIRTTDVEVIDKEINEIFITGKYKSPKYNWGIFVITDKLIKIERWKPASFPGPLKTIVYRGRIIDEKSFVLTSYYSNYTNSKESIDRVYKFREFSPKPDSTNQFIDLNNH